MNKMVKGQDFHDTPASPDEPDTFFELHRPISEGLLRSTTEITRYIFGNDDRQAVRSVFNILAHSRTIPAFKIGGVWCARTSAINAKIWLEEAKAGWPSERDEALARLHVVLTRLLPVILLKTPDAAAVTRKVLLVEEAIKTIDRVLRRPTSSQ